MVLGSTRWFRELPTWVKGPLDCLWGVKDDSGSHLDGSRDHLEWVRCLPCSLEVALDHSIATLDDSVGSLDGPGYILDGSVGQLSSSISSLDGSRNVFDE